MLLILTNDALVLRAFAVLANAAPSNIDYAIHKAYIKDYGTTGYITALNDIVAGYSNEMLGSLRAVDMIPQLLSMLEKTTNNEDLLVRIKDWAALMKQ